MTEKSTGEKLLYCSFCGKSQHEVRKLIAGPSVFICDECIELCNDIIREESAADKGGKPSKSDLPTPREICGILEENGIGQDPARADDGTPAERSVRDRRRDHAHRSGLRRRGRGKHHPEAAAELRL